MSDARDNLRFAVKTAGVFLSEYYGLDAFKARRDMREPGRRRKMAMEARLEAALMRMFRRQAKHIRDYLTNTHPDRKAIMDAPPVFSPGLLGDPEFEIILRLILMEAARDGVDLFAEQVLIGMDYTGTNERAARWARAYTDDLLRGLNATTNEAVGRWIADFVETPGMTIGDVIRNLPFNEVRAQRIATTEITRAYAEGNQLAGEDLKRQLPGVRVVKTWFTNADLVVCPLCVELDGREVDINGEFEPGVNNPPRHVNCRCWTQTTTALADL